MIGVILLFILLTSFLIRIFRLSLLFADIWQRKEYRWDRVVSYFKTRQGRQLLFHPLGLTNWIMLFLFPIFAMLALPVTYFILVSGIFFVEAFYSLIVLFRQGWKLPTFGLRTIVVLLVTFLILLFLLFSLPFTLPLVLLLLDRLVGLILGVLFLLSIVPFTIHEMMLVSKAGHRLKKVKPIVIGITGSYGKTSTKEFLSQILSAHMTIIKTPKSQNTLVGVAETILSSLSDDTEVFIVEMGAYRRGEISRICSLVKPTIGIITGINEQHMELFDRIEETMKAKFELVEHLPKRGKTIINGDNKYSLTIADWAKKRGKEVILYSTENSRVKMNKKSIQFSLKLHASQQKVSVPVLGQHQAQNIMAAAMAAYQIGLSVSKITKSISQLKSPPRTMDIISQKTQSMWIDDSYNSNPSAVQSALSYMQLFNGQKILILQPLIELGSASHSIHRALGKEVAEICSMAVLTNNNYFDFFAQGFLAAKKNRAELYRIEQINLRDIIEKLKTDSDVVVFEGRESQRILNQLLTLL